MNNYLKTSRGSLYLSSSHGQVEFLDLNPQLDEIMNNFDFVKVARVMEFLDWKWLDSTTPPSKKELMSHARRLLTDVYLEPHNQWAIKCGGFTAEKSNGLLSLCFTIEEWDVWEE